TLYPAPWSSLLERGPAFKIFSSRAAFFNLCTIDTQGCMSLCCGTCPVHCRMFSSIPDLYPLDASSSHLRSCDDQKGPRHCQTSSRGQNCPCKHHIGMRT
uniref:Uncharacterized protein n=1 Tax=Sus scrofa TaxID=9823 RepID=A0A8D1CE56_PIG